MCIRDRTAIDEADVFALHAEGGQACVQVFFFRAGQNWGNRAYFPRVDRTDENPEIMAAFIGQFYEDKPIPRMILVNQEPAECPLISEAFGLKAGRKVEISVPKRGEKKQIVDHALLNAREALGRKMAESSAQSKLLAGVCEVFGLDGQPERIEVYDNSHIMGTNAVGGMIVAGPDGFQKNQYRKFNIKSTELTPGDDYAMMAEVLQRRFARLVKEDPERQAGGWPDLVVIDGGAGQLSAARKVLEELGLTDLSLVAVAKGPDRDAGRERFFMADREPFTLDPRDPVLYLVQRLRDEAHRFAIATHRGRRAKEVTRSALDGVPGIGSQRKRALLQHFGSARAVAQAGLLDLEKVPGINRAVARVVHDYFHERG